MSMTIIQAAQSIIDKATLPKKRPTIDELEKLLQGPDGPPVHINPDGSIGVGESEALTVARGLLELKQVLLGDDDMPDAIRPLRYLQAIIESARCRGLEGSDDPAACSDALDEVQKLHDKLKALVS